MRTLGEVPRHYRVEARHILQELAEYARDMRTCMIRDDLNADGALLDLDAMEEKVRAVRKLLSPPDGKARS